MFKIKMIINFTKKQRIRLVTKNCLTPGISKLKLEY